MGECYLYKRGGGGSGGVGKVMTAVGSVIALTNSMNKPLKGLRIFGRTTQNGTPTPTAPVPLVSAGDGGSLGVMVGGKNLFGGVYNVRCSIFIPANTPFTVSTDVGSANTYFYAFRKDGTTLTYGSILNSITVGGTERKHRTWTLTEDVYAVSFQTAETGRYQIEIGSTATEYEPYKEHQTMTLSTPNGLPGIPVASGGNFTDSSGLQWVCDEVDFNRGVRVERFIKLVFNSADGWTVGSATGGAKRFQAKQYNNVIKPAVNVTTKANILCSNFPNVTAENTWNKTVGICVDARGDVYVYYPDIEQTVSALGAYLASNPMTVIAELATPIETPLTAAEVAAYAALHTNSPNTTIYNDGGAEMEVKYMGG